MQKP
jgi:hypothetical protein